MKFIDIPPIGSLLVTLFDNLFFDYHNVILKYYEITKTCWIRKGSLCILVNKEKIEDHYGAVGVLFFDENVTPGIRWSRTSYNFKELFEIIS